MSPEPTTMTSDEEAELNTIQQDDNTGKAVRVIWTDSGLADHEGWEHFGLLAKRAQEDCMDVETVGIWMGENDRVVMVAHSRDIENENWNLAMTILKSCVVRKDWLDAKEDGKHEHHYIGVNGALVGDEIRDIEVCNCGDVRPDPADPLALYRDIGGEG